MIQNIILELHHADLRSLRYIFIHFNPLVSFCLSDYTFVPMNICGAKVSDAKVICSLISSYAERDEMLFRSMADIYEDLQSFIVAEMDGKIVGCCALEIIWSDLAEIKSLAISEEHTGRGVGRALVEAAVEKGRQLGVPRVFGLTLKPEFFEKLGFERIEKDKLPMKVWSDCARCPKQQKCDETAVIRVVNRIS